MFKLGITSKLLLTLFVVGLISAIGVGIATRLSFLQGLDGYLYDSEVDRMNSFSSSLGHAWEESGSWAFLRESDRPWQRQRRISGVEYPAESSAGIPRGLAVYDLQGKFIAGSAEVRTDVLRQAILANGSVVGTLVGEPRRYLSTAVDLRFRKHQLQSSWIVAGAVLLSTSLLAILLARGFLAPIRRLTRSAAQLADGDYEIRVPENRSDELGSLARDFNAMASALQRNETIRRQMMADISHELRTPLSVLRAELDAIKKGILAVNPGTIGSLEEEVDNLARLVDDIRQISLFESGALRYEWQIVDLASLFAAEKQGSTIRPSAIGVAIEIATSTDLLVRADPNRLQQVIKNVIENARLHADGASQIRVQLYKEDNRAVIEIHDDGPGVDEGSLTKLFERFWREDRSRSRRTGGSGLGLAICRSIIEAHSGHIDALRSPLGGLCIRADIPLIEAKT